VATLQNIDCSDASSISFDISIPDIAEWEGSADQSSWSLNMIDDARCEPTFDQNYGVVSYTNINASVCAGLPFEAADAFIYSFFIYAGAVAGSATFPVTFAYDHLYAVGCFYNREQENIMASFEPRHVLIDSGSGKSNLINLNNNQLLL